MRLGLNLGYWSSAADVANLEVAVAADRLGFDSVWTSEAYGSDAVTILGALSQRTTRISLGSAVMQVPGRSAANTAMTAATLSVLSGGRFRLGLGVSGPQVSEGWHGVRFDKPGTRLREYVEIVRLALSGQRVRFDGDVLKLPLPDGPGVSLPMTIKPEQPHIPIYLATLGPKNLELTGQIADGWLGVLVSAETASSQLEVIRQGLAASDSPKRPFDFLTSLPMMIGKDISLSRDALKPWVALYVGGMGSREVNFYYRLACDLGFKEAADEIQDQYLGGDKMKAIYAVPDDLVDMTCLAGPVERVISRLEQYEKAGLTTIALSPAMLHPQQGIDMLEAIAGPARERGWIG